MDRRKVLKWGGAAFTAAMMGPSGLIRAQEEAAFRIGVFDQSLGGEGAMGVMERARDWGFDGVQVSLGDESNDIHLRDPKVQAAYLEAAGATGQAIASLHLGVLNGVPYKSDPRAEQWVSDGIDVCVAMQQKLLMLAFFGAGELKGDAPGQEEVIRRLKLVAPKAEKAGVVLGLETYLDAREHSRILDAFGSPNVQVYYDTANMDHQGYNLDEEIRWLGHDRICQFHAKENGNLLGEGKVDFNMVRSAIDGIGYRGWLVLEGARKSDLDHETAYRKNVQYLRSVFTTEA